VITINECIDPMMRRICRYGDCDMSIWDDDDDNTRDEAADNRFAIASDLEHVLNLSGLEPLQFRARATKTVSCYSLLVQAIYIPFSSSSPSPSYYLWS
jgi:hypothetical protein